MYRRLIPMVAILCLVHPAAATSWRTFVSPNGNDANTATDCGLAAPCRQFSAALTVTNDGGEIVVLDSANYGYTTISKSVTISTAPGVYAGLSVFPAPANPNSAGLYINGANLNVTLKGLTIIGQGGNYGIRMTSTGKLTIENCTLANFAAPGQAISVEGAAADVRVTDTVIRDSHVGVHLKDGPVATISGARLLGAASAALNIEAVTAPTTAYVSNVVVAGSGVGLKAVGGGGARARLLVTDAVVTGSASYGLQFDTMAGGFVEGAVTRSLVSGNATGVYACGPATEVDASANAITHNTTVGLVQCNGASLRSFGNNTISDNGTDSTGTVTAVPQM